MIPVIDGVYELYDIKNEQNSKKKMLLQQQVIEIRKHSEKLILKAKKIYNFKISKKLFENYDPVTCDFLLLEQMADLYYTKFKKVAKA